MLGREDKSAALGTEAVDAEFWALVCEDEEWLEAEFNEVVSDAWENPVEPRHRTPISAAPTGRAGPGRWASTTTRPWHTGKRPGRHWRRERGPPRPAN
jgi:hypothetical protein